jgi:hypothetical protein
MSDLLIPTPSFIFISFLFRSEISNEIIFEIFNKRYGEFIIFEHPFFPMKDFYSKEMGDVDCLKRLILVSKNMFDRKILTDEKVWTKKIENQFSHLKMRRINLDVGIITLENVILATGKNFVHRIYLRDGVFADLNLIFESNSYKALPWTYPDYSHPDFILFFNWVRSLLQYKILLDKKDAVC